jgi:hypothetical protein
MKVFLSWSGNRSKEVASLLSEWLCCVIQAIRPWISTRDLDRGSLWFGEINDQLKDTTVGIICLTQENKTRPWILFEAGALAKGLSTSRVCTFLIDLETRDIVDPLAQFNHTFPTRESILGLVKTLNNALGSNGLDIRILDQVFDTYWPHFESKFSDILEQTKSSEPSIPRPKEDVLSEILENTRIMSSRIRKLESEVDRGRQRELFDISPNMLREQIYDMVINEGMTHEAVFERYRGRIPNSILKDLLNEAMVIRSNGKEKV